MGLPLFISPPSPPPKNASTNTEKLVAQHRSAIRRQRTVRGTPNWALSEIREAASRQAIGDDDIDSTRSRAEASATRDESRADNYARRYSNINRQAARIRGEYRASRQHVGVPPAPTVPGRNNDPPMPIPRPSLDATERPSFMDHYNRISPEHRRSFLDQVRSDSASRSASPPLPPYTVGFTPAHASTSDVRSSSRSPENTQPVYHHPIVHGVGSHRSYTADGPVYNRSSGHFSRTSHSSDYSSSFPPSHVARRTRTRMADFLAQRGRRNRARDLPDGLGDRDRSMSPDNWDTLSVTLTPDPQAPSTANSSFASANASTNPSTVVASAASSASDSQSSATSASETSAQQATYARLMMDSFPRRSLPAIGTRSIPDFSIPRGGAERASPMDYRPAPMESRTPNPEPATDGNCDSGDEFDFPEIDENLNSANAAANTTNEVVLSESDRDEDNAEVDDLYELAVTYENNPENNHHSSERQAYYRSYADAVEQQPQDPIGDLQMDIARTIRFRNAVDATESSLGRLESSLSSWERERRDQMGEARIAEHRRRLAEARENHAAATRESHAISQRQRVQTPDSVVDADESEGNSHMMLGGMQRIVRRLAERRDIPDTWWAGAGLSRVAGRGVGGGDGDGDDDMRLEG